MVPCGDGWPTGPAVWVGPALGDEVPVPAQQGGRLDEEASETPAGEQSRTSRRGQPGRPAAALVGGPGVGAPPPRGAA